MLVDRASGVGPKGGLEQRVDLGGSDGGVRHLVVVRPWPRVAHHSRARRVIGLGPVQPGLGLAPGPPPRVHALRAADEDGAGVAPRDVGGELVHEELGRVAADGRRHGRTRLDAEPAAEQRARGGVFPRHDVDDGDRVERGEHRTGRTGIGVGGAGSLRRIVGPLRRLARADDHGCAGINHGMLLWSPSQAPALQRRRPSRRRRGRYCCAATTSSVSSAASSSTTGQSGCERTALSGQIDR